MDTNKKMQNNHKPPFISVSSGDSHMSLPRSRASHNPSIPTHSGVKKCLSEKKNFYSEQKYLKILQPGVCHALSVAWQAGQADKTQDALWWDSQLLNIKYYSHYCSYSNCLLWSVSVDCSALSSQIWVQTTLMLNCLEVYFASGIKRPRNSSSVCLLLWKVQWTFMFTRICNK